MNENRSAPPKTVAQRGIAAPGRRVRGGDVKEPRPNCEDCFHARVRDRTVACAKGYWKGRRELFMLGKAPKECTEFESMDGVVVQRV